MRNKIAIQKVDLIQSKDIQQARAIFTDYFTDLYKNYSSEFLGIQESTAVYLVGIFKKTEQALINNRLQLNFAYINNEIVGFATYEFVTEEKCILIRTLPINLLYKHDELEIRKALVKHISKQFPFAMRVIIMVRKANSRHQMLCLNAGFHLADNIFNDSLYVKNAYDSKWYYGYSYSINSL